MSFSLLFSWTLTAYYGREGSLNDFLLAQNVDILLQTVLLQSTYRFFLEGRWVVINVRQRNSGRCSCVQTVRSAVHVNDLNWDQVCCLSLKGIFDTTHR